MDRRLLAWARAVKQRGRSKFPVLWLFTDSERLPDPLPAIAALPPGLCGVVFRHDGDAARNVLAGKVAKLCKARRLDLVIAGDARLAAALHAGVHLRGGRRQGRRRPGGGLLTASAHNVVEMRRALRAGAHILFLSPAFATASHAAQKPLGTVRWVALARQAGLRKVYALGGVDGKKIISLAGFCWGVGAIGALTL